MPDRELDPRPAATEAEPRTPDDAREAIADTRVSASLDATNGRIDNAQEDIRQRAEVLSGVRERIRAEPWKALAVAAGAGMILALIGGLMRPTRTRSGRPRRVRGVVVRRTVQAAELAGAPVAGVQRRRARDRGARVREVLLDTAVRAAVGVLTDRVATRLRGR